MADRFHPSPKTMVAKIIMAVLVISISMYYFQSIIGTQTLFYILVLWVASLLLTLLTTALHRFKTVEIGDNSVKLITGIVHIKSIIVPYHNITNVHASQGLLQRIFGLGTLGIDTAGGDVIEAVLEDIPNSSLNEIVRRIEEKKKRAE